jgi:hypothetical protein
VWWGTQWKWGESCNVVEKGFNELFLLHVHVFHIDCVDVGAPTQEARVVPKSRTLQIVLMFVLMFGSTFVSTFALVVALVALKVALSSMYIVVDVHCH